MPIRALGDRRRRLPARNPKGGRPSREIAAKLRIHILDVAFEQFVVGGVEDTSMEAIAAAAKVSKRTLYDRFGSKRALLIATVQQGVARQMSPIGSDIPGGSTRDRLLHVGTKFLDAALKPEAIGLEALVRWLTMHEPEPGETESIIGEQSGADVIRSILEDAGEVEGDDLPFLASLIFDMLVTAPRVRILVRRDLENTPRAKAEHIKRTIDFLAQALPFLADHDARPLENGDHAAPASPG